MDDPFERFDGAYVLGALSPEERAAFEEHLRGCESCSRSVQELAGLPGLLAHAVPGPALAEGEQDGLPEEVLPPGLLPALLRRVARVRRRRWLTAGAAAGVALAACLALLFTAVPLPGGGGGPPGAPDVPGMGGGEAMTPVGEYPVRATVSLAEAEWGTEVEMSCEYGGDRSGEYELVAISLDGEEEVLAGWQAMPRDDVQLEVGTPLRPADISALEVRTPGGYVVLRLPLES